MYIKRQPIKKEYVGSVEKYKDKYPNFIKALKYKKDIKIKFCTPEQSEELQKIAIELGWGWGGYRGEIKEVRYIDAWFLYFYHWGMMQYGDTSSVFEKEDMYLYKPDEDRFPAARW